jgi:hypothetical protein
LHLNQLVEEFTEISDVGNLFLALCRKEITLNLTPMRGLFTIRQMPYSYDCAKVYDIDRDSETKQVKTDWRAEVTRKA